MLTYVYNFPYKLSGPLILLLLIARLAGEEHSVNVSQFGEVVLLNGIQC